MGSEDTGPVGPDEQGAAAPTEGDGGTGPSLPRWAAVALPEHQAAPAPAGAPPPVTPAEAVAGRTTAAPFVTGPRPVADRDRALGLGVAGLVLLGGAVATRLLPDWDEARWWLLEAPAVVLAGLLGLLGAIKGVRVLGALRRSHGTRTGTVPVAVGLALSGLALVGAGVVGGNDWSELDVPAAWDRLELGGGDGGPDVVEGQAPEGPRLIRLEADAGTCYVGPTDGPGRAVDCAEPHRTEVVAVVDGGRPGDRAEYPGAEVMVAFARPLCRADVAGRPGGEVVADDVLVLIPQRAQWLQGDDRIACVLVTDSPIRGARVG